MLCISLVWFICQIDSHEKVFIYTNMIHTLHENLLGTEQLQFLKKFGG